MWLSGGWRGRLLGLHSPSREAHGTCWCQMRPPDEVLRVSCWALLEGAAPIRATFVITRRTTEVSTFREVRMLVDHGWRLEVRDADEVTVQAVAPALEDSWSVLGKPLRVLIGFDPEPMIARVGLVWAAPAEATFSRGPGGTRYSFDLNGEGDPARLGSWYCG